MKLGRITGILLLVFGIVFTWVSAAMLKDAGMTFRLFTAGPVLIALAIALIIFPGGNITAKESKAKTKDPMIMIKEAPKSHLAAWGIFTVVGIIISIIIF
jgi:hypothetical protein